MGLIPKVRFFFFIVFTKSPTWTSWCDQSATNHLSYSTTTI